MDLEELLELTEHDWAEVVDDEHEPFGSVGAGLTWRAKDRYVGLREPDGRLAAFAGALIASIALEGSGGFDVVGIGSVIVTGTKRGQGLVHRLIEPLLHIAEEMGPDRAMLFCRPKLTGLYRRWGFDEIDSPVWVGQPQGALLMPMAAMWRPLREGAEWPPGRVDVEGLPF